MRAIVLDVPFKYKKYVKINDIKLPDKIIKLFDQFYIDIENDKYDIESTKEEELPITHDFMKIRREVEKFILESGNKRFIYVSDFVDFIFRVCLLLLKKDKTSRIISITRY